MINETMKYLEELWSRFETKKNCGSQFIRTWQIPQHVKI